jgi:hypothetical protein
MARRNPSASAKKLGSVGGIARLRHAGATEIRQRLRYNNPRLAVSIRICASRIKRTVSDIDSGGNFRRDALKGAPLPG